MTTSVNEDRRQMLIRVGIAVIVLGILLISSRAGWRLYKNYSERHAARLAREYLAQGNYRNARLSARKTLQLDPTNVPACRVMAALAGLAHSPAALDWLQCIAQAEPSVENKLQMAAAGLLYQNPPYPMATRILDELRPTATNVASYQVVAANLAARLNRLAEAEAHLETATRLDPTNHLYAVNLAIIRLGQTNEAAAAARAMLEKLDPRGEFAVLSLRALTADRMNHGEALSALAYSRQLLACTNAAWFDHLQHLGILRELKSDEFAAALQSAQRQAATNAVIIAETASWMQRHGLLSECQRWLTHLPAAMRSQPGVVLALAEGDLQGNDWQALRDFTSHGNWEGNDYLRLAMASIAWDHLGVFQVAQGNWVSAIDEAGSRLGALTRLWVLAEKWKSPPDQQKVLERMVELLPQERWAQHLLEPMYLAEGNTPALNRMYARLFPLFTNDVSLENNLAYTCLLLKTNLAQATRWAEQTVVVNPNRATNAVFAATYAFALQLRGKTDAGLAILGKLSEQEQRQPDIALYYGVLLAAKGQTNEARRFLEIAQTKQQWLPEESRLLVTAMRPAAGIESTSPVQHTR